METELARALKDAVLRRMAGEQSYNRGHEYFKHGHVVSVETTGDGLRAVVRGEREYAVSIVSDEGVLDYLCDCQQGAKGAFCKHCVAAALAGLNQRSAPAKRRAKPKKLTLEDAAQALQDEDRDALVRMLLGWAQDDSILEERLLLYAARRTSPEAAVEVARKAFTAAVRIRGFLEYRHSRAWGGGVLRAIDNIAQLLLDGHAAAVVDLCESTLAQIEAASHKMDDSAGYITMLRNQLQDLHLQACKEARPDPVLLAGRLFQSEFRSDIDVFRGAALTYAGILGAKGLQAYRQLAEVEWAKVPVRTATNQGYRWEYFGITSIMESLARATGDIEGVVAVKSRDLSAGYRYCEIAQVYREAGQHDQALLWAETGLQAFPKKTDQRLREFAAEEYSRRGRHGEAIRLMWTEFSEQPGLPSYVKLERFAVAAGCWPEWRERAIKGVRESAKEPGAQDWTRALLVKIFLYEDDAETAWREAQGGRCPTDLWYELAARREERHPEDAALVYVSLAEADLVLTSNGRYQDSVKLLAQAAALMKRIDRSAEFVPMLEALREKHKVKRNFLKLLDGNRALLYLG